MKNRKAKTLVATKGSVYQCEKCRKNMKQIDLCILQGTSLETGEIRSFLFCEECYYTTLSKLNMVEPPPFQ